MRKLLCLIICAILCSGLLCACDAEAEKGEYSQTLSEQLRAEIVDYYGKAGKYDDEDTVAGRQYYGTYNGYVILMTVGNIEVISEHDIDGRIFLWSSMMSLSAYKDGAIYSLEEIYQSGEITSSDLDELLGTHKAFFATEHNWDYDYYLQQKEN